MFFYIKQNLAAGFTQAVAAHAEHFAGRVYSFSAFVTAAACTSPEASPAEISILAITVPFFYLFYFIAYQFIIYYNTKRPDFKSSLAFFSIIFQLFCNNRNAMFISKGNYLFTLG